MATSEFKSVDQAWRDLAGKWNNGAYLDSTVVEGLDKALKSANDAIDYIQNGKNGTNAPLKKLSGVSNLSISKKQSDIDSLYDKRRRMLSFCNGIHYETIEKIDNPFSVKLGQVAQAAYNLNPSKIKLKKGFLGAMGLGTSLTSAMKAVITDPALQKSFLDKVKDLDEDQPSATLTEAIDIANFWKTEFKKMEECRKVADEIFTQDVIDDWPNMTPKQRKALITKYAKAIGKILGDGKSLIKKVEFDANGYGVSYGNGTIKINSEFINGNSNKYNLNKLLDTVTHEVKHEHQSDVIKNPEKYNAPQSVVDSWSTPYVSASVNYTGYWNHPKESDARAVGAMVAVNRQGST